jgi:hypothetical protein
MKYLITFICFVFVVSCGDSDDFEAAEISSCLNEIVPHTEITEEQDEENETNDDDSVVEDQSVQSVSIIEKKSDTISFYLISHFVCEGIEYGYNISTDSTDSTQLLMDLTSKDIWPDKNSKCICDKKMTVSYSDENVDLTKIEKIKLDLGDNSIVTLQF